MYLFLGGGELPYAGKSLHQQVDILQIVQFAKLEDSTNPAANFAFRRTVHAAHRLQAQ